MFELRDASFAYGATPVLKPMSRRFEPGRFVVIVGPNGAGKSTLLKLLTGELTPAAGHVLFGRTPIRKMWPALLARHRAVLPQSNFLTFPFTVHEVAGLGLMVSGMSARERKMLIAQMLTSVDLVDYQSRLYQHLSGGEQQRVQLARVLCQLEASPVPKREKYLFLDEPISSLDIRHQIETMRLAQRYARAGSGVIAVLHDLNIAAQYADEVIVMHEGTSIADAEPGDAIKSDVIEAAFGVKVDIIQHGPTSRPHVLLN